MGICLSARIKAESFPNTGTICLFQSPKRRRTTQVQAPSKSSQNISKTAKGKKKAPPVIVEDEPSESQTDSDGEGVDGDVPPITKTVRKEKVFKAWVWHHYKCKIRKNVLVQANCIYCGTSVPCNSKRNGTSSALSHYRSCNANPNNDKAKQKQSLLNFTPIGEEIPDFALLKKKFDILAWWKMNAARFPHLSEMAKDVLVVPVSSVASESAFSTSGRVLSDFRSSLTPKSVEALICTQD